MALELNNLFPVSFRGVSFLASEWEMTTGPKIAINEYPNSGLRLGENLGVYKRVFKMTCLIAGDNYLVDRTALVAALQDGSLGTLYHPIDGAFQVFPTPSTIRESTRALGECNLELTFYEGDPPINPVAASNLYSQILSKANQLDTALQGAFVKAFNVSQIYPNNFGSASAKMNSISSEFNGFKSLFNNTSNNSSDVSSSQSSFNSSITKNISTPAGLSAGMSSLFGTANNISQDPKATGNAFTSMFGFASGDTKAYGNSLESKENTQNTVISDYLFNAYALLYAYLNYAQADFANDQEIEQITEVLETQYLSIINGELLEHIPIVVNDVFDSDLIEILESLRTLVRRQLDADNVNVSKVITVNVMAKTSASILSYQYYGTTDQTDQIVALNNPANLSYMQGNISVLALPS